MGVVAVQDSSKDVASDCLQRQLAELEALQAMYPGEGEFEMAEAEVDAVTRLQSLQECVTASDYLDGAPLPQISFTIHLLSSLLGEQPVSIHLCFPRLYPQLEAPSVRVDCSGLVTRGQHQQLSTALQAFSEELKGQESVLEILQKAQELVADLAEAENHDPPSNTSAQEEPPRRAHIVRRVLWFHHLKAMSKRKAICDWGKELRLGGYCKPGFPGVLIFEGDADDVNEYQQRLQRLRWQAFQQRGEDTDEGSDAESLRRFPIGIEELSESGMSELASHCKSANLEPLFLTALKIER